MKYKVYVSDAHIWRKDCSTIPKKDLKRIVKRIKALRSGPWSPGVQVKRLQDFPSADFRLRVGDYRVLFNLYEEKRQIRILRALHRSKLY